MKITLGSDPELFLIKNGKFVSAVGKCKGTKDNPFVFQKGFKIHNDNVAVEFNVPPATTVEQWVENHHTALKYCRDLAKSFDCNLKIVSDAIFPDKELDTPEAREFGCNPDFSAWELTDNQAPSADTNLRTAGGHIHIGAEMTFREKIQTVRLLDIFLGIPLKMLEPGSRRNEMYGNPGCMRDKPYGVEYRTPSNFWLRNTGTMMDVFNTVMGVVSNRDNLQGILERVEGKVEVLSNTAEFKRTLKKGLMDHGGLYAKGIHEHVL